MRPVTLLAFYACLLFACASGKKEKFSYDLIPIASDDKWGYIDPDGKVVINPQFKSAYLFSEELAIVESADDKKGYIGKDGKYVINPIYKYGTNFSEGLAFVVPENGFPTCITRKGETKFVLKDVEFASAFEEGLSAVRVKDKWGFIDKSGKFVIPAQFDKVSDFSEGYAAFGNKKDKTSDEILWGFIDKKGKIVINPQFKSVSDFREGMSCVSNGKKYGFINAKGVYVINPQYDDASRFSEGLAAVKQSETWGFVDKKGKLMINPQFEEASSFKNGHAAVRSGKDNWGYIDKTGKFSINPQFKSAGNFAAAFAPVVSGDKLGFINKEGKYIINPQYNGTYNYFGSGSLSFFYDVISYAGVETDFYDVKELTKKLFDNPDEPVFFGFTNASTLSEVVNHSVFNTDLKEFSRYSAIHNDDIDLLDGVSIDKVLLTFKRPIFNMVGQYYYGYRIGENKQYDLSTNLESLTYTLDLNSYSRAAGKGELIAESISDELKARFRCTELPVSEKATTKLSSSSYTFTISHTDNEVGITVTFLSSEYQAPGKPNLST